MRVDAGMSEKPTLLLVDDEERILRSLSMLFRPHYRLHATTDAKEALRIVQHEPVHVIISDQRMPVMRGAELLREVRERSPHTMRLLLTGYSEYDAVVDSVNEGEVFRFISKPWDGAELRQTVQQAAEIASALMRSKTEAAPAAMEGAPDPDRDGILVIDQDPLSYAVIQDIAGPKQAVHWGKTLDEGFEILASHDIAVVVSELIIGRENLGPALKMLKAQHPEVVTLILTPFRDVGMLVELINQGQVYRFLPKPARRGPLSMSLASALKHHQLLSASPVLRRRHAVEPVRSVEDGSVAAKLIRYLARLRGRPAVNLQ
jgi:serine/threonine-protein kinase